MIVRNSLKRNAEATLRDGVIELRYGKGGELEGMGVRGEIGLASI